MLRTDKAVKGLTAGLGEIKQREKCGDTYLLFNSVLEAFIKLSFSLIDLFILLFCVYECFTCMYVHHVGVCGGQKRTLDSLRLQLWDGCEPPSGCWELVSGSL